MRNCLNHKGFKKVAFDGQLDVSKEDLAFLDKETKVKVLENGKDIIRLYECPLTYITKETSQLIGILYMYEDTKQFMYSGGIADQPHWFIEAIDIFKQETYQQTLKQNRETNGK
jgi:hypothetical protein